jgi:hypothetical protein
MRALLPDVMMVNFWRATSPTDTLQLVACRRTDIIQSAEQNAE